MLIIQYLIQFNNFFYPRHKVKLIPGTTKRGQGRNTIKIKLI